jgi:hypothetical protein
MKTHHAPTVRGYPRVFQQLEGARLLPLASGFYAWVGRHGGFFAILDVRWAPEGVGWLPSGGRRS